MTKHPAGKPWPIPKVMECRPCDGAETLRLVEQTEYTLMYVCDVCTGSWVLERDAMKWNNLRRSVSA